MSENGAVLHSRSVEFENWERIVTTWSRVILEMLFVTQLELKLPAFSYHIHKISSLGQILNQINTVPFRVHKFLPVGHILVPHFLKTHFNVILPLTSRFPKCSLSSTIACVLSCLADLFLFGFDHPHIC